VNLSGAWRALLSALPTVVALALAAAVVAFAAPRCRSFGVETEALDAYVESSPALYAYVFCGRVQTAGDEKGLPRAGQNVADCKEWIPEARRDVALIRCVSGRAGNSELSETEARAACWARLERDRKKAAPADD
jgi:hypothetical protein